MPFFKEVAVDTGFFYVVTSSLMIVFFSNAVNLTDGLDGAILPTVMVEVRWGYCLSGRSQ